MSTAAWNMWSLGPTDVPVLWKKMLPEDVQYFSFPSEAEATCLSCIMVASGEYKSDCQCCTYFPEIPNFMLGYALKDKVTGASAIVQSMIKKGFTLPEGMQPSPKRYIRNVEANAQNLFGDVASLACPIMDSKNKLCRLYGYRNSVCSTFFCKNDHAQTGNTFWEKFQGLVGHTEAALSQWAMNKLNFPYESYRDRLNEISNDIQKLSGNDLSPEGWSEDARSYLWGNYFGREADFFRKCSEVINQEVNKTEGDSLWEIAKGVKLQVAATYENNVRQGVKENLRFEAAIVSESGGMSLQERLYETELAHRRLWQLPFGEGKIKLNPEVLFTPTKKTLPIIANKKSYKIVRLNDRPPFIINKNEYDFLIFLQTPMTVDGDLLASASAQQLASTREFLAICLRRGVLQKAI